MAKRILIVLIAGLLFGCQKDNILQEVEIEKKTVWKPLSQSNSTAPALMNSHTTNNYLFVMGYSGFMSMSGDTLDDGTTSESEYQPIQSTLPAEVKFPITDYFYAYPGNTDNIFIRLNLNQPHNLFWQIRLLEVDSTFKNFYYIKSPTKPSMLINQANQLLVPYYDQSGTSRLLLVNIEVYLIGGFIYASIVDRKVISLARILQFPSSFYSVGNNFYIDSREGFYKVNTQGELSLLLSRPSISSLLQVGSDIYGVSPQKLYKSTDDGNTWNEVASVADHHIYNYTVIDNKIVAYRGITGEVFEATFSPNGIALRELENDGIGTKYLTSLNAVKGRVYVTTFTGLYYRDLKGFFDDKKQD